jgi:uncharacterized membrane protein YhdT
VKRRNLHLGGFLAWFVSAHTRAWAFPLTGVFFVAWLVLGQVLGFDRFPYPLLTMFVSLWAILLSLATLTQVDHVHDHAEGAE